MNLIGPYSKYIKQHQLESAILNNNVSLACMTMFGHATGWFEIIGVLTFDLDEVTSGNDNYIDTSSSRVIQLFNITCIIR